MFWKKAEVIEAKVVKVEEVKEMELSSIKRKAPSVPPSHEYREVLDKSRNLLGYICGPSDYRLGCVLAELEIDSLDFKDVEAYKASKTHGGMSFVRYPIATYRQEIPIHVLNKAIQIKEKLPEAEFFVDNYERNGSNAGDPFLWVSVAGWGRYVEVWDEPKFEQK